MKLKSILFVTASLGLGGSERCMVEMIKRIDRTQYEITVLALIAVDNMVHLPSDVYVINGYSEVEELFIPMSQYPKIALKKGRINKLLSRSICWFKQRKTKIHGSTVFWEHLARYIPNHIEEYDAVIGYGQGIASYFAIDKVPNVKKRILWLNTDLEKARYDTNYLRRFYLAANAVFTDSQNNVKNMCRLYPQIQDRLFYFPNMMDIQGIYNKASEYVPTYCEHTQTKILTVGRFAEAKALHLAVEAASILKSKGYDFKWYLVGDGNTRTLLEKKATDLGIKDYMIFCGAYSNPYPWFANCNLYVQTSIYEGSCMTINEAMLFNKAVVCTNFPSAYEKIVDGKNGYLAEMNGEDIANKIMMILDNPQTMKKMSEYQKNHPLVYENILNIFYQELE